VGTMNCRGETAARRRRRRRTNKYKKEEINIETMNFTFELRRETNRRDSNKNK
jgi:hypothetical protein